MTQPARSGAEAGRGAGRAALGGGFLAGAGGRLLPASVPFRWFGAAAVFHALAWLALAWDARAWPTWPGGLGWPLAALHLATVGTLLASAIGASLQLLPVATRQPVRWPRLAALLWWLFVPGVVTLALGMGLLRPAWIAIGAVPLLTVIVAWGVLLALNLGVARGMPGVVLHGWGATVGAALLAGSAAALVALWNGHALLDRDALRALHLAAGVFGTMGLLAFGLAAILLPMFVIGPVPPERAQLRAAAWALGALTAGVAAAVAAALGPGEAVVALGLRSAALGAAAVALALHVRLMRRVIAGGMRRDLGRAGVLMHLAWAAAAMALLVAAAKLVVEATEGAAAVAATLGRLFVLLAVAGWLLGFLLAVLQRIVPFLAAMHAAKGQRRPPTPSALMSERALAWHARCHVLALALLVAATVAGWGWLAQLGALVGAAGGVAFGVFFFVAMQRMRRSWRTAPGRGAAGAGTPHHDAS